MRSIYKRIVLVLCAVLLGCQNQMSHEQEVSDVAQVDIVQPQQVITSPNDSRVYEALTLANGLRVLLVSDPKASDSAVAVDVHVGSFDDPKNRLGLAHFTEHMLFIGTEKYPDAAEYRHYIEGSGGSSNAYTAGQDTVYFFSIKPFALEGALDRFSQFFIAPTFEPAYVERERNAVDSEYRMRFKDDGFRAHAVQMLTANPEHPGHRFHVGNKDTLSDANGSVHRDLVDFYQTHYSADKMTLVIVSPHDLAILRTLVEEKFSQVPKLELSHPPRALLLEAEQLKQDIYIEPNEKRQTLELIFPTTLERDYKTKPMLYVAEMIDSSAAGSVKSFLKNKDWITDLSVAYGDLTDEQRAFTVAVTLTDDGLKMTDEITEAIFAYVQFLKSDGVQPWIFDEIKASHVRAFNYEEYTPAPAYSVMLTTAMQEHPTEQVIQNAYIGEDAIFSPQKIKQVLDIITPENMRRIINAKGVETDRVEPYFQVPYRVETIQDSKISQWQSPSRANYPFELDTPNPYMPKTFEMVLGTEDEVPRLLNINGMKAWYQLNTTFNMPKVRTTIGFWSPQAHATARDSLMTQLFIALVGEDMQTTMRHVGQAGASGGLYSSAKGLELSLNSFTDRHQVVAQVFVNTLLGFGLNDLERFESIKEERRRIFESYHEAPPYVLAADAIDKVLLIPSWTPDEVLAEFDSVSLEQVREHGKQLIANAELESFIHGNMSESTATEHLSTLLSLLAPHREKVMQPGWQPMVKVLAPGSQLSTSVYSTNTDRMVALSYMASGPKVEEHIKIALLTRMMSAQFFSQLRTQEQLGYVVHLGMSGTMGVPRLSFLVQSPTALEGALIARIERFIKESTLDEDGFQSALQSYLADLKEPFKTLGAQQHFMWSEIVLGRCAFDLKAQLIQALEEVTLEELSRYFEHSLTGDAQKRLIEVQTDRNSKIIPSSVLVAA